ncbi:hypothetical protein H072_6824 [Dactylellina haptotyla CBS 200.50]|uniref:Aminoglycoside phosphotransferase domain-containing protein n=1 Tax=Dactylellina haptotyla (strain CBS 200.50) TaxID=1284197 RepID=S8BJD2_DACHA|nr:hypothetical protein H072_6824 [Dactylellina haptotyla CBS 200.50]
MLLTFDLSITPSPLTSDFHPQRLHPLHKLYLDFRIYLARTLVRFFSFLQRIFSIRRTESGNPGFRIAKISGGYFIKWGVRDVEARSMCFVRERTRLPVPKVLGFWSHQNSNGKRSAGGGASSGSSGSGRKKKNGDAGGGGGGGSSELNYMLIEALPGLPVGEAWAAMDETARTRFKSEFVGYLRELRALEQPAVQIREADATDVAETAGASSSGPGDDAIVAAAGAEELSAAGAKRQIYIGALHNQPLTDHRIATIPYGPFESVGSWLNCEYLLGYVARARPRDVRDRLERELTKKEDVHVVFTHSDLTPRNVLVDKKTGRITGIVDWDSTGWCVDWWEGVKGVYGWNDTTFALKPSDGDAKVTGGGIAIGSGSGLMDVWKGLLTEVIGDFDNELKADGELRDIYGFPY